MQSWDVARVRWTSPCGRSAREHLQERSHFDRCRSGDRRNELRLNRVHSVRPMLSADDEPRRQLDPRLGWSGYGSGLDTRASAVGSATTHRSRGYPVNRIDEPVDPERTNDLFTGESVMFGEGLTYAESIPAQVVP